MSRNPLSTLRALSRWTSAELVQNDESLVLFALPKQQINSLCRECDRKSRKVERPPKNFSLSERLSGCR